MGRKEQVVERAHELMYTPDQIRNIGIVAHIDHGKTTLSDNLIAGAGLLSADLAGKAVVMDSYVLEAERGITIFAANISMVFGYEGKDYLVNLIDTPGHVDFGGQVTRAMRAVDGVVIVACAVEGVMPQTERVISQAMKEKVKPVLFINKIDRLINELQVTPEQMQERLTKIITKVNDLIRRYAPDEQTGKDWQVAVQNGTVAFGSAYNNWAISYPFMKKSGITFKDIYDACKNEKQKELSKKITGYMSVIDMVIKHLPSPNQAQKYRIPKIWAGDLQSKIGKGMTDCDKNAPATMMITALNVDPQAGEIATGRVYSGTVKKGVKVKLINSNVEETIQQVAIYMNTGRAQLDEIPAGSIAAISGLKTAFAGETGCEEIIEPFEAIKHYSEPVITRAIEAKSPKDLPKLIEVLREVAKEDPTVTVEIDEETGEQKISGMGELHLEIIEYRITNDKKVPVTLSQPLVVYRETVSALSPEVEGKSPNKHNKFYLTAEPMEDAVYDLIVKGEIKEGKVKDSKANVDKLKAAGLPNEEAKNIWSIKNKNMLIDMTKGVQALHETKELVVQAFEDAMMKGPMANEKLTKIKFKLTDAKLHEDAVHRGPSQTLPAVKRGLMAAVLSGSPVLLEPKQKIFITVPQEYMGAVTNDVQGRRGQILDMQQEADLLTIISKVPVAETFGFAGDMRSASQGRAQWSTEYLGYEPLPNNLMPEVIRKARERKGLKAEMPKVSDYLD